MIFCTAVNCMDGRIQLPVIKFLKERFSANHVDMITEPGPNRILSELTASMIIGSIITRIDLSIQKHSVYILILTIMIINLKYRYI